MASITRRVILRAGGGAASAIMLAACGETQVVTREVPVETTVVKEVPIEKIVTKTEIKEVPVDRIVTKTEIKEVPVERVVTQEKIVTKQVPIERVVTQIRTVEKIVEVERNPRALTIADTAPQLKSVNLRWGSDWVSGSRGEVMKATMAEFAKQHPQVTVVQEPGAKANDKLTVMLLAGTAPHMQHFDGQMLITFSDRFFDLTPLVERDGIDLSQFVRLNRPLNARGEVDGMPFQSGVTAGALNASMFAAAGVALPEEGWTFDDLLEKSQQLTDAEAGVWGIWSRQDFGTFFGPPPAPTGRGLLRRRPHAPRYCGRERHAGLAVLGRLDFQAQSCADERRDQRGDGGSAGGRILAAKSGYAAAGLKDRRDIGCP